MTQELTNQIATALATTITAGTFETTPTIVARGVLPTTKQEDLAANAPTVNIMAAERTQGEAATPSLWFVDHRVAVVVSQNDVEPTPAVCDPLVRLCEQITQLVKTAGNMAGGTLTGIDEAFFDAENLEAGTFAYVINFKYKTVE